MFTATPINIGYVYIAKVMDMPISLVSETPNLSVDLDVGSDVIQALASSLERSDRLHGADDYRRKLAQAVAEAVGKTLPWELQPPSSAQLSFAASISRRLQVEVPVDAARYRGAMHEFISAHAELMEGDGYHSRKKSSANEAGAGSASLTPMAKALLRYHNRKR